MNSSLQFNEQSSSDIQPEKMERNIDRHEGTTLRETYVKGMMAAEGTLDAKNKDRVLENLIKTVFDDILTSNHKNIKSNDNILKLNLNVIENAIKNTKLSNFVFDVERICSIIEGYAEIIKQKTSK